MQQFYSLDADLPIPKSLFLRPCHATTDDYGVCNICLETEIYCTEERRGSTEIRTVFAVVDLRVPDWDAEECDIDHWECMHQPSLHITHPHLKNFKKATPDMEP